MSLAKPIDGELADVELSEPKALQNGNSSKSDAATVASKVPESTGLKGVFLGLYSGMFHDGLVRCYR